MKRNVILMTVTMLIFSLFPIDSSQNVASAEGINNALPSELGELLQDEIVDKSTVELLQAEEELAEMMRLLTEMPLEYAEIDISLPKLDWLIANTELDVMKVKFETDRHNYIKYLREKIKGGVYQPEFSFTSCLKGIGETIVYNAVPAAKILKIKKL